VTVDLAWFGIMYALLSSIKADEQRRLSARKNIGEPPAQHNYNGCSVLRCWRTEHGLAKTRGALAASGSLIENYLTASRAQNSVIWRHMAKYQAWRHGAEIWRRSNVAAWQWLASRNGVSPWRHGENNGVA